MKKICKVAGLLVLVAGLWLGIDSGKDAIAGSRTFPAGSYIIPLEPCWQPNNDTQVITVPAGCDPNKNDQGIFHAYGMVYDLLANGVPAYWIINPDKVNKDAIDFSIGKGGAAAAVQVIHSGTFTSSGTLSQVDYRGGPFVIDINDLTPELKVTAENIIKNIYTSAKVHIANYDFSAPVDKTLSGTPPKVAVLGEGATQVLLDYLKASGLGNRVFAIFTSVTTQNIIDGVLDDYQLLWAPHWIIEQEVPLAANRDKVLSKMRGFLEKGNAGFFECASLESLESSVEFGTKKNTITGLDGQTSGGFLTDKLYTVPRIDADGGSMNQADLVYESPAFYLDQCSGWKYVPQGGHVHNFRPRNKAFTGYPLSGSTAYKYNTTVTRFIHDRDNYVYSSPYPVGPPSYDYFVGGRINGTATQGYVAYLAGHRYIKCSNTGNPVPSDRIFDIYFDRDLATASYDPLTNPDNRKIWIEAVYAGCTQGVNCPKIEFDIANPVEHIANDGKIYLQSEGAAFGPYVDPNTGTILGYKLSPITVGNLQPTASPTITKIVVTFTTEQLLPGPQAPPKMTKIIDVTNSNGLLLLCSNASGGGITPITAPYTPSTCVPYLGGTATVAPTLPTSRGTAAYTLGQLVTSCTMDWSSSNTCGIRYVLNTLLGLQFQIVPNEYNKASPIAKDNIVYKATFEYPGYKGHLYAINGLDGSILWDAGKSSTMPAAGPFSTNPSAPSRLDMSARYVFTNVPGTSTRLNFDDTQGSTLKNYLDPTGTKSLNWARSLISLVRGRYDATEANPLGSKDVKKRLGGIEHSAPAVFVRSSVIRDNSDAVLNRDKIVFVGADDGMLHAFYAGKWDATLNAGQGGYDSGTGKEIWAYIPSTLLPSLQNQTFTDCNPGDYLQGCDPNVDPNKCVCPTFSAAVAVDSSPFIGDFFVDHDNNPSTPNVWKTILVGTAVILAPGQNFQSVNQGIVFALDVTDPYSPQVLWEKTYKTAVNPASPRIERHYYPASFPESYITAEDTLFDINMGNSRGAVVGRVQVGTSLSTYIFLTSKWINQVNTGTVAAPHNVWGMSVYALNFRTGDLVWETKILHTGDAEGVNETPASPVLMDVDDTGTQDYVAFGDMQGRLWILRTTDGASLTVDPSTGKGVPAYTVKDSTTDLPMGAKEPIGSAVSVHRNYIVFGTGARDSLTDEATTHFRVFGLQVTPSGIRSLWTDPVTHKDAPIVLNANEKVWAPPLLDAKGNVYIATGKGYSDVGRPDLVRTSSTGRFMQTTLTGSLAGTIIGTPITLPGAVVGGIDSDSRHAYVVTFDGTLVQIGGTEFPLSTTAGNPIKVLWWKKL
jgi:hypothetical protein